MPPQRWRLTLRRDAASDVVERGLQQAWEATLRDAGLLPWPPEWLAALSVGAPAAGPPGPRLTQPKVVAAAPLPLRMTADRELVDLYLPDAILLHDARRRLEPALPPGHDLVDLYDVWFGAPALPGMVVAADYRVEIDEAADGRSAADASSAVAGGADRIAAAIDAILASESVPRGRTSEGRAAVNLRPLILSVCPMAPRGAGSPEATRTELWMRLRLDSSVGSGRPDDVVDAIAARTGRATTVVHQHRERLWLRDDPGCPVLAAAPNPDAKAPPATRSGRPGPRR